MAPAHRCSTQPRDVHVRIKLSGSPEKREFFNYVVGGLDRDWPWCPPQLKYSTSNQDPFECPHCGGTEWRAPNLTDAAIRAIATQINLSKGLPGHLKVKMKEFKRASDCAEVLRKQVVALVAGV